MAEILLMLLLHLHSVTSDLWRLRKTLTYLLTSCFWKQTAAILEF